MTAYGAQIDTARRLIADKGQMVEFNRAVEAAYDPGTDTVIGMGTTTFYSLAVALPASQSTAAAFDVRFPGPVLTATNLRVLLVAAAGLTETPSAGDRVIGLEGDDWTVVGTTPLAPDGTPIVHTLTVKR